jgi:hypothetical protein
MQMIVDIFIRTYSKDLEWLAYALKSIHKNVTGFRQVIVAIPNDKLLKHLTLEKVVEVEDLPDGYIGQQMTKIQAWRYTDADAVLFWDSDTVALEKVDVSEFFKEGKPIIYKTKYSSIDTPWQPITEAAIGDKVEWEYMRRMPLLYWRDTLVNTEQLLFQIHDCSLKEYLGNLKHRAFSEFNTIGALAEKHEAERYEFIDTETGDMTPVKIKQFWSWGGITNEVKKEIERI